jgi:folate-binding Fe-S cluster repair protein YgfZ
MLNEHGGIVDDMIVYRLDEGYRLVVNASTRDQDLAWMQAHLDGFDVQLVERSELAMLAIQGPHARQKIAELVSQSRGNADPARSSLSKASPTATGSSRAPATPAKTAWKSSCRPIRRRDSSTIWWGRAFPRSALGRAIPCGSRPA